MSGFIRRAQSLLREVVSQLEQESTQGSEQQQIVSDQNGSVSTGSTQERERNTRLSAASSASEEFRRRFPAMCSSRTTAQPLPKKRKMAGYVPAKQFFVPKETWTHDFCVLGRQNENITPTRQRLIELLDAGLGKARLTIKKMASHEELAAALEEKYPKLKSAGGYEILRAEGGGGGQRKLSLVSPGSFGYTAPYLRDRLGQAVAYIRPLQSDMNETPVVAEVGLSPKVTCINCNMEVVITNMRDHQQLCGSGSSSRMQEDADSDNKNPTALVTLDGFFEGTYKEEYKAEKAGGSSNSPRSVDAFAPGTSSTCREIEQVMHLSEMFPDISTNELRASLAVHGTVASTALSLTNSVIDTLDDDNDIDFEKSVFQSKPKLETLLEKLKGNLSDEREKIKVEEDDLLNDAMSYYKDPKFNPRKRLRIIYKDQPAADTGGVTRQFFTQLLGVISTEFFHGDKYKCPIYNSQAVASGMLKLCGTIIVHSILQGGPGLPIFSPSVYYYIATGDSDAAIQRMTISDCSLRMQSYIQMVASADDVSTIDASETIDVLSECGLTTSLTNENKMNVIQSIIVHDAIGKPKIVLDQLREGLSILGFRKEMERYPDLFLPLFVLGEDELKGTNVVSALCFQSSMNGDEITTHNYLKDYLLKSEHSVLKNFLVFTTGAPSLPSFGLGNIQVKFDEVPSIFASTCLQEVTFPRHFPDEETFSSSLDAVVNSVGHSFNCI